MTATKMNAQEIIQFIANAEKKTSVKVTLRENLQRLYQTLLSNREMFYSETGRMLLPLLEGLVENQRLCCRARYS